MRCLYSMWSDSPSAAPAADPAGPLWIDTDVALGAHRGDVDDGYAIAAVLCAAAQRLVGISTVSGNAPADVAAHCARDLLCAAGVQKDVLQGALRAGQTTRAAEAIAALPAGAQVLALGPLSNIAAALQIDPGLAQRITLYAVGGNLSSHGRFPPLWPHEFNLALDPEAAALVFAARMRRRIHPMDACGRLLVSGRDLLRMADASPLGAFLVSQSLRWWLLSPLRLRALRFPLWDLAPALDALGLLPAQVQILCRAVRGRGLLVPDRDAGPSEFVCHIDRPAALRAFESLLRRRSDVFSRKEPSPSGSR